MANTDDLRYQRTEEAIRAAFLELVQEKPLHAITASDVCRRAGKSRNAFYLHHASISALFAALIGDLIDDIRTASLSSAERSARGGIDKELSSAIVEVLARHEETLRVLLPHDDGTLAKRLAEGIEESFVDAALSFGEHGGSLEHRLRCSYTGWAMVGIASRWIAQTGIPVSELLPQLEELQRSSIEASTAYLLGEVRNG